MHAYVFLLLLTVSKHELCFFFSFLSSFFEKLYEVLEFFFFQVLHNYFKRYEFQNVTFSCLLYDKKIFSCIIYFCESISHIFSSLYQVKEVLWKWNLFLLIFTLFYLFFLSFKNILVLN